MVVGVAAGDVGVFCIVDEMLKCKVPSLLLRRDHHGAERWGGGASHGRSSLLQNEGIAHHEVVQFEDSAYKQGDVTYPDCDCVALHVPSVHELKALEKAILGHGCKEPGQVLVVQLVGFIVVGCLLDECRELAQLAGGITFSEGVGAGLPA